MTATLRSVKPAHPRPLLACCRCAQIVERIELRVMLAKAIGNERLEWNIFVANKSL